MRSLSLAILIFPAMSVIRGYFQGLNDMKPIALSQIYEQVVRVIWMLVFTFMIMKLGFQVEIGHKQLSNPQQRPLSVCWAHVLSCSGI